MSEFNYDFKKKMLSVMEQSKPLYEQELNKIFQEDQNPFDATLKILDLRTSNILGNCTIVMQDYHQELMKFLMMEDET